MLDSHHNGTDNFTVSLAFRQILPSDFSPINLSSVEYFKSMSIIDLDSLLDVRALYDGSVISVAGLNMVNTLVEAMILVHD